MRILVAFIVGVLVGAVGMWYVNTGQVQSRVQATENSVGNAAKSARDALAEKLRAWKLSPQEVGDELSRTGQVVRRKAEQAGQALANAASDARITAAIEGKLVMSRDLSSQNISVSTTGGVVTLTGNASSPEVIGRAMLLAMETDGVREVVSKLQVRREAGKT